MKSGHLLCPHGSKILLGLFTDIICHTLNRKFTVDSPIKVLPDKNKPRKKYSLPVQTNVDGVHVRTKKETAIDCRSVDKEPFAGTKV